ncbi:RELT-like protein 2 [Scleropages formosus]|nr:RELT-like protein 2 [Scleropages formosus]
MTDQETTAVGESTPQYMIFLLVFFFFLTGLLGFLICHMLKKKGYRCRTGELDDEEEGEAKVATSNDEDGPEENQDTVEQILKCIIENEANIEAFKEMLGTQNTCEHVDPRLVRKESVGGIPPHHHTVHSGIDRNTCHLCVQSRSKKARRRSRVVRFKARPGEQTVFSVGRFRVTHIEKKNSIQESPNMPMAASGELLECRDTDTGGQEGPKETYNLQNMFKDVSPEVSSVSNGIIPLSELQQTPPRRSSDPAGVRVGRATAEDGPVCGAVSQQAESPSNQEDDTDIPTDPEMSPDKASPNVGDIRGSRAGPERTGEVLVGHGGELLDEGARSEEGRDDMVEMEDIRDCRVSQSEEAVVPTRDEKRRSVHVQHKW